MVMYQINNPSVLSQRDLFSLISTHIRNSQARDNLRIPPNNWFIKAKVHPILHQNPTTHKIPLDNHFNAHTSKQVKLKIRNYRSPQNPFQTLRDVHRKNRFRTKQLEDRRGTLPGVSEHECQVKSSCSSLESFVTARRSGCRRRSPASTREESQRRCRVSVVGGNRTQGEKRWPKKFHVTRQQLKVQTKVPNLGQECERAEPKRGRPALMRPYDPCQILKACKFHTSDELELKSFLAEVQSQMGRHRSKWAVLADFTTWTKSK